MNKIVKDKIDRIFKIGTEIVFFEPEKKEELKKLIDEADAIFKSLEKDLEVSYE